MDRKQQKLLEAKKRLYQESLVFKNTFRTADGEKCLEYLKSRYIERTLASNSTTETVRRAAEHDVVQFIIDMVNYEGD